MNAPKYLQNQVVPEQSANQTPEDEINLIEVLAVLVERKGFILSVAIIFTLLATGYALSISPKYRATIGFLMPQENFLPKSAETKSTTKIKNIISETKSFLYQKFLFQIQSYDLQREVFDRGKYMEKFVGTPNSSMGSNTAVLEINSSIKLKNSLPKKGSLFDVPIYLEMEGSRPEAMAGFLNDLVETAIKNIHFNDYLLDTIKQQQLSEISLLTEQLEMARSMNAEEMHFDVVNLNAPKWYLWGSKALEKQLEALQPRVGGNGDVESIRQDDGFNMWESAKTNSKNFKVVDIIQSSVIPTQPINPNQKAKIILLGVIAGLLLGMVVALIQNALGSLRERQDLLFAPGIDRQENIPDEHLTNVNVGKTKTASGHFEFAP